MKNINLIFVILISYLLIGCATSGSVIFEINEELLNDKNEQVLFITTLPKREFTEKGLVYVQIFVTKGKEVLPKMKTILQEKKYDAIINIKQVHVMKAILTNTSIYGFTGIGVTYNK